MTLAAALLAFLIEVRIATKTLRIGIEEASRARARGGGVGCTAPATAWEPFARLVRRPATKRRARRAPKI